MISGVPFCFQFFEKNVLDEVDEEDVEEEEEPDVDKERWFLEIGLLLKDDLYGRDGHCFVLLALERCETIVVILAVIVIRQLS